MCSVVNFIQAYVCILHLNFARPTQSIFNRATCTNFQNPTAPVLPDWEVQNRMRMHIVPPLHIWKCRNSLRTHIL